MDVVTLIPSMPPSSHGPFKPAGSYTTLVHDAEDAPDAQQDAPFECTNRHIKQTTHAVYMCTQ